MTPFQALLAGPDGGSAGTAVSAHFFGSRWPSMHPAPLSM